MAAIFYSKVTSIALALATIAGLLSLGGADLFRFNDPLNLGVHALTAIIAIYVGFTANRNLVVGYAKVSSLLYIAMAVFGMYQNNPYYGSISAHLAIGLWGAWAGFGASEPVQAGR